MIDDERNIEIYGYKSTDLTHGSNKPIVCRCDECGGIRILSNYSYRDLCHSCAQRTPEARKKKSDAHIGMGIKHHKFDGLPLKEIGDKYLSGVSRDELARYYGCCNDTIKNRLVELGIAIRDSNRGAVRSNKMRDKISNSLLQFNKDNPDAGERHSAWWQDQDYDDGEWTGYTDKHRPHLIPIAQCIHLNPIFDGCNQHHIMPGVIINIPPCMHKGTWHIMPNAKRESINMKKINELAFKYLMGDI